MATPCLSRLLLIFLLGAIQVVAHPMSKDKPAESGNVVVQRSPCLRWKPKEENHRHIHYGSQEPAVTFQEITVKLDDKDASKHKSDADADEESTKTEYPSEASSKHDETMGTTHNHKDMKKSDRAGKLTDEEIDEMGELARRYLLLSREEKKRLKDMFKRYQHMMKEEEKLKKSKPGRVKEPKYNLFKKARKQKDHKAQLDNLEKYKGYKPKNVKPWWALTTDKHDEAIHHRNELAPTGEEGVETKRKIRKRCGPIPLWVYLIIEATKINKAKKKAKKEEERQKKERESRRPIGPGLPIVPINTDFLRNQLAAQRQKDSLYSKQKTKMEEEKFPNVPLRDKPKPWSEDKTSKAFNEKPSEEKESQKNKGSGLNDKPNSSALRQKNDKENKQKSEVQPNTASEHSKDEDSNQNKNSLTARSVLKPILLPPSSWRHRYYSEEAKANRAAEMKENIQKVEEKELQKENIDEDPMDSAAGHTPSERKGDYSQGQEEQTNTASEDSNDGHSNQSKNSLIARSFPDPDHVVNTIKTCTRVRERRIQMAYFNFVKAMQQGQEHQIKKAYFDLQKAVRYPLQQGQRGNTSRGRASAKSKHLNDIDD
ncbi:hypothetical protein FNYG_12021 [Fusarium nygamai]|uniref:Uncharacterized protein n=1 Tax=Gibberella nygamai TaxID=42673 RepID=A0A2K0VXE0_GIBNY|nr:hypothetical protein FNYG_12021 [Fusarium nygamai]